MNAIAPERSVRRQPIALLVASLAGLLVAGSAATAGEKVPGLVDGSEFIELAGGDDAVEMEIKVSGALLKIGAAGLPEDLGDVVERIESIQAIIVAVEGDDEREAARDVMAKTETSLEKKGWERLALVRDRDDGSEVRVLVLNDETAIRGLVVMVLDGADGELIFANVAGDLDLEAMKQIGEELEIPGLNEFGSIK